MKELTIRLEEPLVTSSMPASWELDNNLLRFAAVALSSLGFAFRTWIVTIAALYVAFWL
jgi:hypothetical protein